MKRAKNRGGIGLTASIAAAMLMLGTNAARAATFTWDGTGNASAQANWLEDGNAATRLPGSSDDIVLDATSTDAMTWDAGVNNLTDTVASWTQTADYTGTVTIDTRYPGQGDFQLFTIDGALTINGGVWTHSNNAVNDDEIERFRLNVKVNDNFTLGATATINADIRGYRVRRGPGKGDGVWQVAPSHGGQGGKSSGNAEGFTYNAKPFATTYGSIREPTRLGSGGGESGHGGGAVRIEVTGATQLDGTIWARGGQSSGLGNGSGGSIWLTTGTLAGDGELDVAGGAWGRPECGGGGRIAVIVKGSASTGNVDFKAYGGARINDIGGRGGAGTVYIETTDHDPGEGRLIVNNNNSGIQNIPSTVLLESPAGFAQVIVTNTAAIALPGTYAYDFATSGNIEGGGEVRVQNATGVTFPNPFTIGERFRLGLDVPITATGDWTIATNGVLTHGSVAYNNTAGSAIQPDPGTKLFLTLTGDLTIANGGRIDVDAKGHGPRRGIGRGETWRVGASHGGEGGINSGDIYNRSIAATYGDIRAPFLHGSGGGESGAGGGVARLDVSGAVTIEAGGEIHARGNQLIGGNRNSAGGSIWIRAASVSGAGLVDASGGTTTDTSRPSGGGGRIAVIVTNASSVGALVFRAFGGAGAGGLNSCFRGAAGTVYLETTAHSAGAGDLIVDNNNNGLDHFYAATAPSENVNLSDFARVVVTNHGILAINDLTTVDFGTAALEGGGEIRVRDTTGVTFPASYSISPVAYRLALDVPVTATGDWTIADGGLLTHSPVLYDLQSGTGGDPARKLDLTLTGNLTVESGGRIDVDARGNGPGRGYGRGKDAHRTAGSYGGEGGTHDGYTTVPGYGSVRAPFLHGSGSAENGIGGGVVKLDVSGTLAVDSGGTISAKGGGGGWPNGSGGSIWLRTGSLTGTGLIDASGGDTAGSRSGGGGGRVAVVVTSATTTAGVDRQVFGGNAGDSDRNGAAGTLYIETQGVAPGSGRIVADNNNLVTAIAVTDIEAPSQETPALVKLSGLDVLRRARVRLRSSRDCGALNVATNAQLDLNGYQLAATALTVAGTAYGSGEYAAADLGAEVIDSDPGLAGRIILPPPGTLFLMR